jgi:HEPN domain-containing protein
MSGPDPQEIWQRVAGWIRHAEEDARIARGCLQLDPPSRGGAAFHCQQAAEKLLKGFLVRDNIDFGRTHDLERLSTVAVGRFPAIASLAAPIRAWTAWSVAYRYPGEADPEPEPTTQELGEALSLIERLVTALQSLGPSPT